MRALVVDDDKDICRTLVETLELNDIEADGLYNLSDATSALERGSYDLLITDQRLPDGQGMDLLKTVSDADVFVITGWGNIELAVEAMRNGAKDFLTKPIDYTLFQNTIQKWKQERLLFNGAIFKNSNKFFDGVVGNNKMMLEAVEMMEQVAPSDVAVLITGETGTGKELIAQGIHKASNRLNKPFVNLNCAAIPENLLESELFGYERGAFTGAVTRKRGKFLLANSGSIFLDEIGDMSLSTQAKLLRVLQEKVLEPLGSEKTIDIDVRIIAATNKNLEELVRKELFREDLLYRLNVVTIKLPTLMERQDDIPELTTFFIAKFNDRFGKKVKGAAEDVFKMLRAYSWPGNIRELSNMIERAVALTKNEILQIEDFNIASFKERLKSEESTILLKEAIEDMEKGRLARALAETGGNQLRAAEKLGMKRTTLRYKLQKYRLISA